LSRTETAAVASVCYAIGVGLGLCIAFSRAPAVLWIGLAGVLLAYQYNASPLKLSYRGLGEIAVALCYGPLIATRTYLVQVQTVDLKFILATIPLGLAIAAFLWINEFPDYAADKEVGKNTLVVRLWGQKAARMPFCKRLRLFCSVFFRLPAPHRGCWSVCLGSSGCSCIASIACFLREHAGSHSSTA
jgi:1,4-dihydroxy-2-naphthoate octaprenyltransferase